ncbi:phage major capsid protein [Kribbella deserti]|uniref:Mu-like prophage major head subunit gpT family protein n=1 Tax=Kribbella deserti TaxID=1926257 RepID=A0ABV6QHX2_9ACTN
MSTPQTQILTGSAAEAEAGALTPRRRSTDPNYLGRLAEAARLIGEAFQGNSYAMLKLKESLTTSDFPILFGDVLDRELMAQYEQIQPLWQQFARRTVVRDFRPKKWADLLGGRGILDPVAERAPYPARGLDEAEYELTVGKYGARLPLTWEMFVNDDLDAFRSAPERLGQAARDTEDMLATKLVAGAAGPTAFFNGNGGVGTGKLTVDNLSAALTSIGSRKDSEGRPIVVTAMVLMVPPALEVAANNILQATLIRFKTTGQDMEVGNWLANKVRVVVNPWLTVVDESANVNTTWYLLPAPTIARPAVTMGFLRGYEVPDLRVKADGGNRLGGGAVPAEEGSFDDDSIQYRVRHVTGGTTLDPIAAYASNGSA